MHARAIAVVILALSLSQVSFAGESPTLFSTVVPKPPPSPPGQFLAEYRVAIDLTAIQPPTQTLTLNLPGRQPEVVTLQHWEPREGYIQIPDPENPQATITIPDPSAGPSDFSWRWYGRSASYTVGLTVVKGLVVGRIAGSDFRYSIDSDGLGNLSLGTVNSSFWKTHPGDTDQGPVVASSRHPSPPAFVPASPFAPSLLSPTGSWDATCSGPLPGGQHVIDVLMLYSQQILADYSNNVTAVTARLTAVMDNANQAMRNSGITNVVLSPRGPELLANETSPLFNYDSRTITESLDHMAGYSTSPAPPYYVVTGHPYISGRRNAQWADVVALARRDLSGEGSCGVSFLNGVIVNNGYPTEPGPSFDPLAYLVFDPNCDADRLNFAHEMGHQLGMDHDPSNFSGNGIPGHDPSCPWSFGHRRGSGDTRFRFRTVMAYWQDGPSGGGPLGCSSNSGCPLIDSFSTPFLEWAGLPSSGGAPPFELQPTGTVPGASAIGTPVGTPSLVPANGADTIRRVAPTVAVFRARPDAIFAHGFE